MPTPVEEIKQRLDLVDFINEHVPLKPAGQNWKARCPFHNERTPSFMVSRERGTWHCFGCGRGGDIFTFLQELEGLEFPEALRVLAKRAGVTLRDYDPKLQTQRTKVLDVLRWVSRYYHQVLLRSKEAAGSRDYLRERGLSDETIEDWQLGYASAQPEATYQALRQKGFADDDIFQAGLTIKKDRGVGYLDRFRGRIMFPIADPQGTTIAFSGRIYEPALEPNRAIPPKYINSPQTIVYNKSLILYGLDKARAAIKKANRAIIVEGYMDCLASHQAGVTNVVATCGTALTRDQVHYLKRFTNALIFAFDQDPAGAQAVLRGVDQALQAQVDVFILTVPHGKDPDELIRRDPAAWGQAITQAKPALDYFFSQAMDKHDLRRVQDKKAVARELLPIIAKVADPIEQAHYLQRLAAAVGVEAAALKRSLSASRPTPRQSAGVTPTASSVDRWRAISERLLALLIHQPQLLSQVAGSLETAILVGDDLQRLYKTLVVWYTEHRFSQRAEIETLVVDLDPDQQERFTILFLLADKEFSAASDATNREEDLLTMFTALKRRWLSQQLYELEQDIRRLEGQTTGDQTAMPTLLDRFQQLTRQLRELN
ncbi:MAG: DNA primase [Candidatus Kerfeldbacteria bacterium]|nr:DNA primase [Candidatus Kerfeldbacteria bacterium]